MALVDNSAFLLRYPRIDWSCSIEDYRKTVLRIPAVAKHVGMGSRW